jgi:calcineurin-like phosphoesterase family protein
VKSKFATADPHWLQQSMLFFAGRDGKPLRPWGRLLEDGETVADVDPAEKKWRAEWAAEDMVERWNAKVPAQGATTYVLGDVVMNARELPILARLNGKKKLIKGNHDLAKLKEYAPYFYDISAYRIMDGLIMSHIPIHEESLKERWKANVHGHLHDGRVMMTTEVADGPPHQMQFMGRWVNAVDTRTVEVPHPRYLCVSVEHTDYAPLHMDEVFDRIAKQQGDTL